MRNHQTNTPTSHTTHVFGSRWPPFPQAKPQSADRYSHAEIDAAVADIEAAAAKAEAAAVGAGAAPPAAPPAAAKDGDDD